MATRFSVCYVCLEHKGARSKKLTTVSEPIIQKINAFVNYKYDPNLEAYSTMICSTCQRNLYLLHTQTKVLQEVLGYQKYPRYQNNYKKFLF